MTKGHAELNWREPIMRHFSADIARSCRVTVVADPDGLLLDDLIATQLLSFRFEVLRYDDPIRFRFLYETQHRRKWDQREETSVVISAGLNEPELAQLPFDVLWHARQGARVLSISLAQLFSGMAVDVLAELDKVDLDPLWLVRNTVGSAAIGRNQTLDFVLRAVFKLSPDIATTAEELLGQLARVHYVGRRVPRSFATRFEDVAKQSQRFPDWPLADLVAAPDLFLAFLQERWLTYLASVAPDQITAPTSLTVSGPAAVAFGAPELRAVADNLFTEGRLQRAFVRQPHNFEGRWEVMGVQVAPKLGAADTIHPVLDHLRAEAPEPNVPPTVWTAYGLKWAELTRRYDELTAPERRGIEPLIESLRTQVDGSFRDWLLARFAGLTNRSFLPTPTMVHQIPHFMAHRRSHSDRIALIVVDGMSISQWLTIKDAPGQDWRQTLRLEESALFAWVPTITSISRQAMLAGEPPLFFAPTILSTHAEERHWKNFWEERGRRRDRVAFVKHGADEPEAAVIDRARTAIDTHGATVMAVILNSVDRLVHGVSGGATVLQASVRQWGQDGHFAALVHLLTTRAFDVFVASDHGNVDTRGLGCPNIGTIPDARGSRAIVFPDANTRDAMQCTVAETFAWPGFGLPESLFVVLADGRRAFVATDAIVRSHGGVSIDEMLVPFVRIARA